MAADLVDVGTHAGAALAFVFDDWREQVLDGAVKSLQFLWAFEVGKGKGREGSE